MMVSQVLNNQSDCNFKSVDPNFAHDTTEIQQLRMIIAIFMDTNVI